MLIPLIRTLALCAVLAVLPAGLVAANERALFPDGAVLLLRHANAPGVGDPAGFRLGDCATQRNLDGAGREQAARFGRRLRELGVTVSAVWTSRWCRARDTASLAFPDRPAQEQPAFDSSFGSRGEGSQEQSHAATALLQQWKGPGVLVVTTHQVNITALTGMSLASGEAIVVQPRAGRLVVLGRFQVE